MLRIPAVSLVPQPWLQASVIISSTLLDLSCALQQKGPCSAPVYLGHAIPSNISDVTETLALCLSAGLLDVLQQEQN